MAKFTHEIEEIIVAALQRGLDITSACERVHISRVIFYRWYKNNKDFEAKVDRAKTDYILMAADVIYNAIRNKKDVTTAKWVLERKLPNEFGNKAKLEVENENEPSRVIINFAKVPVTEEKKQEAQNHTLPTPPQAKPQLENEVFEDIDDSVDGYDWSNYIDTGRLT